MTEQPLTTIDIQLEQANDIMSLFGPGDTNLKIIENALNINIVTRGESIQVSGKAETIQQAEDLLKALIALIKKGIQISGRDVVYAVKLSEKGMLDDLNELYENEITVNSKGKPIRVKTLGQQTYVKEMNKNDMVFAIGPAGTGKTYLAVVKAVSALKAGQIKRIVLTRPAVEAGESLGFLPGDLKEKVDPYLRPLYDALNDVLGQEHTQRLIERGTIEIAPLAYMRGRTLEDAYVILDEAQNTTPEQMKMFLTRLGFGSKMIVTGDVTQIDLPKGKSSGLKEVSRKLSKVKGVSFVELDRLDVVRHPLVQRIIEAYEDEAQ